MQEAKDETVRDAGMLAATQAVGHYEIARYGTLVAWADKLGMSDVAELLRTTLQEEKDTDAKLFHARGLPRSRGASSLILSRRSGGLGLGGRAR